MENITSLHKQFVCLGKERNMLTYKLLALLPKIAEQEVYKKYGYASIYEYAGILAGLPRSVVEKTLLTQRNLKGKPHLQKAVESEGIHKVAIVAKLATPKNDGAWADKVKNMSKHSLCELAREVRAKEKTHSNPCQAAPTTIKIELDDEMQIQFLKLKKQYEKSGRRLSNKETMRRLLSDATEKDQVLTSTTESSNQSSLSQKLSRDKKLKEKQQDVKPASRYIPVHNRKAALQKSDGKCAYSNCLQPADTLHHAKRFSETGSHQSVIPLCKIHHEFAHNGLIKNEEMEPGHWELNLENGVHSYADAYFRGIRRGD